MLNRIIGYFDLNNTTGAGRPKAYSSDGKTLHTAWQYVALFLGIFVEKYWSQYRQTQHVSLAGAPLHLAFALITALILFPGVYKNSFNPGQNQFVQFCVVFTAGIGWQSVINNTFPPPS
jgi:hypothetical protein